MSKITLSQFSFNRGELDPALHGRSDWKYYYSGAETLRNLIARPQGGAVKRGGLRLVAPALDDAKPSRLIPFRFSVKQSYMLELGDRRMRIIKDGGLVVYPKGHANEGQTVTVETPWPAEALPLLRHAQTADVMIFAHPDFPPRRLARHDHHDWRYSLLVTNSRTPSPAGLAPTLSGGDDARYVVTAHSTSDGESPPSEAVTAAHPDRLIAPDPDGRFSDQYRWLRDRDASYIPAHLAFDSHSWSELVAFLRDCGYQDNFPGLYFNGSGHHWCHAKPNGLSQQTLDWTASAWSALTDECLYACDMGWAGNVKPALSGQIALYVKARNAALVPGGVTKLAWEPVAGAVGYRVYREAAPAGSGDFRLLGETTVAAFTDAGLAAKATGLPEESDLFTGLGDYPGVCAFFEQRLILGRSNNQPTTFWGSETGLYNSFGRHTPVLDSDSYEFTLASGEMDEIHWIVPLNDMLFGTSGSEWKAGGGGSAITPSNINARVQSWYGCAPLEPVVTGRTVIFAGRSRRTVRAFSYSLEADGYAGRDLAAYAGHLFAGRTVVDMCHQREPSGVLWVVMSDGALLSCTYAPEEDVAAWARHDTRGKFDSCGSLVDLDGTDQIYFCVAREIGGTVRRFIETLSGDADAVRDECEGFFLDCGLTYRGNPTGRVAGLDHLEGELVSCLADGCVFANLPVANGQVDLPNGFKASLVHCGLAYSAELITLELEPEARDSLRNRPRFAVAAVVRFVKSRECRFGQAGGTLSEMKFRTDEAPGRPIRLFTGEKNVSFTAPPGLRAAKLRFLSETPTPLSLLGVIAEASCGQPA